MSNIRNFLILSTSHIKQETAEELDCAEYYSGNSSVLAGGPFSEYGWFMYAQDCNPDGKVPSELMDVFAYANAHDCDYVLFDRDAEVIEELPTWEWS